jgi:large subunit ribosomal protein L19
MNVSSLVENRKNPKIPPLSPGDTVKVSARIVEGGKERIQVFQGVVIQVRPGGAGASFTVRHVAFGIGVERTFPYASPLVEKVEIVRHGKVRRSKLYYLRNLSGRQARRKIKRVERKVGGISEELAETEAVVEPEEIVGEEGKLVAAAPEEAESAAEPVAEEAVEEPKAEVTEEPSVAEEPKAEVVEEAPATEEKPAEEPKAEVAETPEAVAEPVAEETEEKPVAGAEAAPEPQEAKPDEAEEDKS